MKINGHACGQRDPKMEMFWFCPNKQSSAKATRAYIMNKLWLIHKKQDT